MPTLRDLMNGYSMGGGGVERAYSRATGDTGLDVPYDPNQPVRGPDDLNVINDPVFDQFYADQSAAGKSFTEIMDLWQQQHPQGQGGVLTPVSGQTASTPTVGGWQMPGMAFAPGASQNAPRLFQDPTTGQWTLSEHGNFRGNLSPEEVTSAQGYVTDFWNQFPTGFIQPGQTNFDPNQALSNEQYGQPSNWQSLYTNAGLTPPTQSATPTPLIGQAQPAWPQPDPNAMPSNTGGTLSELSNPERVNQLSQSSYGGGDMDRLREALKGLA